MSSKTIIIVDTDVGFEERFRKKLAEEDILDKYSTVRVCPDTTKNYDDLIKDCIEKINDIIKKNNVCGIFVDIVIYEKGPLDSVGIQLAENLSSCWPAIPVYNITSKLTSHEELDLFSEATLSRCDGVFAKSYLEGKYFSAKRLRIIFERTKERRTCLNNASSTLISNQEPSEEILKAFNADSLDPHLACQIQDMGHFRFWELLRELMPNASGVLSSMQPGRSDSYVLKVTAKFQEAGLSKTRPKQWVLKLSSDEALLRREVNNYNQLLQTPADRKYFPRLLHPSPIFLEGLGGIVYEFENNSLTLMEYFVHGNIQLLGKVAQEIRQVLTAIYGDASLEIKPFAAIYKLDRNAIFGLRKALSDLSIFLPEEIKSNELNSINQFIKTEGSTLAVQSEELDMRTIHGDLNARNVLITEDGDISLIDFASRRQGHVADDIAKLERDIVFRVFDGFSKNFWDWSRLPVWLEFILTLQRGYILSNQIALESVSEEVRVAASFIVNLRQILKEVSPKLTENAYLRALLHYSLLALLHPEISIHKKAFGVQYIGAILKCLKEN
ncbi:MAG: hypothetical protein V1753_09065 [Pseudomonadota bacterium]